MDYILPIAMLVIGFAIGGVCVWSDVGGHLKRLGKNLDKATEAYNSAIGSIESRVLVQARRFDQMGGSAFRRRNT